MSFTRIWIHCVWTTKNKKPLLSDSIRPQVFQHIKENAEEKGIYIDSINGYVDQVHCIIGLKRGQNIAECMQLIKGESSFWINKHSLSLGKFMWQDDYWAISIGEPQLKNL